MSYDAIMLNYKSSHLKVRKADILLLAEHFLELIKKKSNRDLTIFLCESHVRNLFQNVQKLENIGKKVENEKAYQ